ncbi:MAG: DUF4199 domain-containing protein [Tannerellaceae bacterium]|nr:DUF4199 domain-containing protein [Tannerellaceae bacterium]
MMADNNYSLTQFAMRTGFMLGLFWVFRYLLFMFGSQSFLISGIYSLLMPLTLVFAYFFTRQYRETLDGKIRFGKAWRFGVMLYFFAALIVCLPHYIYYAYINPNYLSDAIDLMKEFMEGMELGPEAAEMMNNLQAPAPIVMTLYDILSNVIYGMIFSLPVAAIVSMGSSSAPATGSNSSQNQE